MRTAKGWSLHHIITKFMLKCRFGRKKLLEEDHIEYDACMINIVYWWRDIYHTAYHGLFGAKTVMEAYEHLPHLWGEIMQASNNSRIQRKQEWWYMLFGKDADLTVAQRKLKTILYCYIFKLQPTTEPGLSKQEKRIRRKQKRRNRENQVFTPDILLANGHLARIYDEVVLKSIFKQHAWNILFGDKTPANLNENRLRTVFTTCLPFE